MRLRRDSKGTAVPFLPQNDAPLHLIQQRDEHPQILPGIAYAQHDLTALHHDAARMFIFVAAEVGIARLLQLTDIGMRGGTS